ncbi:hypothetical protein AV530_019637 [Patagioenas fasciata monilis]|uniref:Uncharacterized protein n=1 Tax=Patagioenas fasciata monilis TaxID=372326 RepID=A0A1V4JEB4_PATFA|nr:hypothetical protein AV530_019637 [Patagioenas fasciata monilis]
MPSGCGNGGTMLWQNILNYFKNMSKRKIFHRASQYLKSYVKQNWHHFTGRGGQGRRAGIPVPLDIPGITRISEISAVPWDILWFFSICKPTLSSLSLQTGCQRKSAHLGTGKE